MYFKKIFCYKIFQCSFSGPELNSTALLQPTVWLPPVGFVTTVALFEVTFIRTGQPD